MNTSILTRAGVGALGGVTIGSVISLLASSMKGTDYLPGAPGFLEGFANENTAVLIQLIVCALLGAVCALAASVYDAERLSIAVASLTHLGIVAVGVFGAGWYLQWFVPGQTLLGFAIIFLIVYALMWVGGWLHYRQQITRVNEGLTSR